MNRFDPPEKLVQHRFGLFKTLFVSFFCRQIGQFLLNGEEPVAEVKPLADVLCGGMALGDGLERLVELATRMSPASHHCDFLRQLVVARIAIRVQIAPEALQEGCWMLRAPSWLVLVQHNGTLRVAVAAEPASPVQPHVAL